MTEFGEILKELRTQSHISQGQLAERLGVHRSYISKLEHGATEYLPSEEFIVHMARAFGVNEYDLLIHADKVPTDFITVLKLDEEARRYMKDKSAHWLKKMGKEKKE